MNYLHSYHAGNHADVFKHIVLVALLRAITVKNKPFVYIDTHAGEPFYDLQANPSQSTNEYKTGIAKLWQHDEQPLLVKAYLEQIYLLNDTATELRFYPGSAWLANQFLRSTDRAVLADLNPTIYQKLKSYFKPRSAVHIHLRNGYELLTAVIPPQEHRGLVLIDPSYEDPEEWQQVPVKLIQAYQRWQTGIYALWYPIKDLYRIQNLHLSFQKIPSDKLLRIEFSPLPSDIKQRLNGSGMLIINPPWLLKTELNDTLPYLLNCLAPELKLANYKIY